jgi:hypothetical protein
MLERRPVSPGNDEDFSAACDELSIVLAQLRRARGSTVT